MGLRPEAVQGSLRFSLAYHNTEQEVESVLSTLTRVTERLRRLSGHVYA